MYSFYLVLVTLWLCHTRKMSWYPFQYNTVLGFKNSDKINLGTTSDEAAKHFDAFVTGMVLSEEDPSYTGKSAYEECLAADPTWVTPKIISSVFGSLGMLRRIQLTSSKLSTSTT